MNGEDEGQPSDHPNEGEAQSTDHPNEGEAQSTNRPNGRGDRRLSVKAFLWFVRFLWLLVRLAATAVVIAATVVTDDDHHTRARRWILLEGDRWRLVAILVGTVGVGTFLLSLGDAVGVADGSFVATTFGAVISGLFSFVPIVIAVNQLTVSRLFGSPEQFRQQVRDVDAFRREFESDHPTESISPTEPAKFLELAVEVVAKQADALERSVEPVDGEARAVVDDYVAIVRDQVTHVSEHLDGSHQPLIEVLPPMMGDSYSRNVNDVRRIRDRFGGELPVDARDRLDELEESFVALAVLRQYFKALYLTQELSYLSRLIGYTGVGAFVVATLVIMAFANGQPLGGHPILLDGLLSAAFAAIFLPFAVLLSFVLRVATIAKRTAAPGPFTPYRETPDYATHRTEMAPIHRE